MHILYVDESGSVVDPAQDYFALSGIAVFERGIFHLERAVDNLVAAWGLGSDPNQIEIHGSPMYQGSGIWRKQPRADRERMMNEALGMLRGQRSIRAFGVAMHKSAIADSDDPVLFAFEEICIRFDRFLIRIRRRAGIRERQPGLVLLDESQHKAKLQLHAQYLRDHGTRWGRILNLPQMPVFVDSRYHRIVQLADLVAYGLRRRYEYQDDRFFDPITSVFDAEGGVIHGLVHYKPQDMDCYCPACMSRRHRETGQRLQA